MDAVSHALVANAPLPISLLSELGKGPLRKALADLSSDDSVARNLSLWLKLVQTASSPQVTDKHITAASNALCVYLSCSIRSPSSELGQFVLTREVWFEAFHCSQKAFDDGKTKPAFQILDVLCDLLPKLSNPDLVTDIVEKASLPLVRTIVLASPRSAIKKACLVLSCFLRRTPLIQQLGNMIERCVQENEYAWEQRLSEHNIVAADVWGTWKSSTSHLFLALTLAMIDLDTRSAALKMCSVLCNTSEDNPAAPDLQPVLQHVVELYLDRNHAALGSFAENVLPVILHNKEKLLSFIQPYATSCRNDSSRMALFIATIKVGKTKSILSETETLDILSSSFSSRTLPDDQSNGIYWCKESMKSANPEVQILTYGLLVSSPAGNAVVLPEVLECIDLSVRYLHDHSDAHERSEILSITKRLLTRLHDSKSAIQRSAKNVASDGKASVTLEKYTVFTQSFYRFLKDELDTGLSYPRHILSLLSLQHFLDLSIESDLVSGDEGLVRALISLVLDPFEDVRDNATSILRKLTSFNNEVVESALSDGFLRKVEALVVKTGRADHADAAGRILALRSLCVSSLNRVQLSSDCTDLVNAVWRLEQSTSSDSGFQLRPGCAVSIHADLLGVSYRLRYLGDQNDQVLHFDVSLVQVCLNVWDQVRAQLCVDSPETASEVEDELNDEGPKDLLAFCWRALRDSSIVLQSLMAAASPSRRLFKAIGDLCMDQLISLRHRGAFSTVAQTFSQCCETIRHSGDLTIRNLIQDWYQVALSQIDEQASRLTRRSAGLPAMITGLLSPADTKLFSIAIVDLMEIARRPPDVDLIQDTGDAKLPQVHALNCLKDIVTNSRFSAVLTQYIGLILELAAKCLSSKVWAVRNCGLMLLRACINRLDASTKSEMATSKSPPEEKEIGGGAPKIAFELLKEGSSTYSHFQQDLESPTEHVFAGLDLLAHIDLMGILADEARGLVTRHLSHPNWSVRDHAAFLLATRVSSRSDNPVTVLLATLEGQGLSGLENGVHGRLLYLRHLMEKAWNNATKPELCSVIAALDHEMVLRTGDVTLPSPYTLAAWLDLVNDAASAILKDTWDAKPLELQSILNIMAALESITTLDVAYKSYVSPGILLFDTLNVLIRDKDSFIASDQMNTLIDQAAKDSNALSFVLHFLERKYCHTPCPALFIFLVGSIREALGELALPTNILEQVFTCVTVCLERLTEIPPAILQTLLHGMDFSRQVVSRDLRNAAVKLWGALLGSTASTPRDGDLRQHQLAQWLRVVQDCASDEMDFPTRMSAATALLKFFDYFGRSGFSEGTRRTRITLLWLLYDLLNDDDEEVRNGVIQATRTVCSHETTGTINSGYCALAARQQVIRELEVQFAGTTELAEMALLNIMRIGHNAGKYRDQAGLLSLLKLPMASKLLTISQSKNDLFAEERQNLYIEDVHEISMWIKTLRKCYAALTPSTWDAVKTWTLDGLQSAFLLLETDERLMGSGQLASTEASEEGVLHVESTYTGLLPGSLFGHPLGVTYDHEILVLLLQAISLAGVLHQSQEPSSDETLRRHLQRVRDICYRSEVNPVFLCAVEHAMGEQ